MRSFIDCVCVSKLSPGKARITSPYDFKFSSDVTSLALSTRDDSDEGKNLSPRELSEIKDVLTSVENKLNKLKTSLFQESE